MSDTIRYGRHDYRACGGCDDATDGEAYREAHRRSDVKAERRDAIKRDADRKAARAIKSTYQYGPKGQDR